VADEAAAEQRAILVSFETRHRDESAQQFVVARRGRRRQGWRTCRQPPADAHRRNIEAARAAMAEAEQRLAQAGPNRRTVDNGGGGEWRYS
jgi:hypothetical protein